MTTMQELFGDPIYVYTREQAIDDGFLVDVSEIAREAGFKLPVAVTSAVWGMIENIPPKYKGFQDVNGRLWDVLWMASLAVRRSLDTDTVLYRLIMHHSRKTYCTLKAVLSFDNPTDANPCITIMLPEED